MFQTTSQSIVVKSLFLELRPQGRTFGRASISQEGSCHSLVAASRMLLAQNSCIQCIQHSSNITGYVKGSQQKIENILWMEKIRIAS